MQIGVTKVRTHIRTIYTVSHSYYIMHTWSSKLLTNRNKSRLLFSSAEMFKKPLWQTVKTQIRLFWIHAVCFYTYFVSNVRQLFAADEFSRQHFQMHLFLGALRVKAKITISPLFCRLLKFFRSFLDK